MLSPRGARGVQKAELNGNVDSENNHGGSSGTYVLPRTGCSQEDDQLLRQGCERSGSPQPWTVAMEATIFTGWIYDHLLPHAQQVKLAHPLMLRAIAAAKKKNDRIDADKIADCLRCDFLPECHMASTAIRDRRRTLRYRDLLVRQMVQMKNRISGVLMESGVSHNKRRLYKVGYFRELLSCNEEVDESIRPLLLVSRDSIVRLQKTEYALVRSLQRDPLLAERVKRLRTVPGVGPITALTWALEIGEVSRFPSITLSPDASSIVESVVSPSLCSLCIRRSRSRSRRRPR